MAYRYRYNDALIAEGERTVFIQNGKIYVRTGLIDSTDDSASYRLREIYDDAVNHPPIAQSFNITGTING